MELEIRVGNKGSKDIGKINRWGVLEGGGVNGIVGVKWVEFREFVDGVWWMVEVGIKNDVLLGIFGSGVGLG